MKQTSNKDFLNAVRNQASADYKEKIGLVNDVMGIKEIEQTFQEYPRIKNEFIQTLTEKVVKTEFFSRVYENPLKMLKKGSMPYGGSIEELFVTHAKVKGFLANLTPESHAGVPGSQRWLGDYSAESLTKMKEADVKALYITKNFMYVYEVSISDAQLKAAFTSANGLSELVNQLVGSLTSGAELKEYKDMIDVLRAAAAGEYIHQNNDGTTALSGDLSINKFIDNAKGVSKPMKVELISNDNGGYTKNLAKKLRAYAQKLRFMSNEYNMAGVETFSNIDDLVFLTTPDAQAEMDVELLASVFNISKAEAAYRTIVVDALPTGFAKDNLGTSGRKPDNYYNKQGGAEATRANVITPSGSHAPECLGILMDKSFLQVIDTVNESRTFDNGRALMTNVFLHRQGMLANCYFANCVAFLKKES